MVVILQSDGASKGSTRKFEPQHLATMRCLLGRVVNSCICDDNL